MLFIQKKKKKKRKGKGKKERREKEKKRKFKKKKRKTKDRKKQRVGSKSRRTQGVLGLAAASLPTGPLWSPWLARAPSGRPASCGPCGPVSTLCTTPGPQGKLRPFSFQSPLSSSELSLSWTLSRTSAARCPPDVFQGHQGNYLGTRQSGLFPDPENYFQLRVTFHGARTGKLDSSVLFKTVESMN